MQTLVTVSITGPDAERMAEIARLLVADRLAACGNVVPGVRSIYRWEGDVQDDSEALLLVHTVADKVESIIERVNAEHPYDTVQILASEVAAADAEYRQWVIDQTA